MALKPNSTAYLESWSRELKVRQDRVRLLIGDAHWLSDGYHKEAIIREFLARHLPNYLHVSRGFVKPANGAEKCSPEIDILISDPARHPPLFFEGDLSIVPPSSIIAHLHVKTRFSRQTLADALRGIARTQAAIATSYGPEFVWRCVCFYEVEGDLSAITEIVAEELVKSVRLHLSTSASLNRSLDILPTCIVGVSRFIGFVTSDNSSGQVSLKYFDAGDLSIACAVADLFSAVSTRLVGSAGAELDQIIESFPIGNPTILEIASALEK